MHKIKLWSTYNYHALWPLSYDLAKIQDRNKNVNRGNGGIKLRHVKVVFWTTIQYIQYIPRNMHTVFALLCFVVVIPCLIIPYPSCLLHWHCGNLTIAPVPAKQPWWIWINTSCEFIMNDCITTTKQSTTKLCAYFLGYTVLGHKTMVCAVCRSVFLWPKYGIKDGLESLTMWCLCHTNESISSNVPRIIT